jgi:hypothetical protein
MKRRAENKAKITLGPVMQTALTVILGAGKKGGLLENGHIGNGHI